VLADCSPVPLTAGTTLSIGAIAGFGMIVVSLLLVSGVPLDAIQLAAGRAHRATRGARADVKPR
jgi:hypothetical protein